MALGGTAGPAVNSTQRGSMENILNGNLEYAYIKDDGGITKKGGRVWHVHLRLALRKMVATNLGP